MRVRRPAPNTTLNLAPFGRWTLRDEAAQRRLAPRYLAVPKILPAPRHTAGFWADDVRPNPDSE